MIRSCCNMAILYCSENLPVSQQLLSFENARQISGVRSIFGEVYPDPVRVVSIGRNVSV